MVLDAVASAAASLPDLRLYMCYRKAPLIEQVRRRIERDPALRTRVHLLGEIPYSDIQQHLRAADFLVQGSHHEGSSYGAIEALACGTSPLVTDIASFRRITDYGRVGAIVRVGHSDALAREIVQWSRKDRHTIRTAARAHFERELSTEGVGRQLRESYQNMVQLP